MESALISGYHKIVPTDAYLIMVINQLQLCKATILQIKIEAGLQRDLAVSIKGRVSVEAKHKDDSYGEVLSLPTIDPTNL